ncbi:hypothetical protein E2E30_19140 (plasmid) [Sphingomonas sp. AAP5]|jgi:hypothetical protein|uniref:hypothetical protein n=2 Tax=Pseudomonadota TaxID=1224 RepID=UPI001056E2FD|nr:MULTISPECIES: hypothetical protein [unclassified Sphingomonas]QBM77992.1 hypothetical protein E2E30_19140 [Sphingomonas sp. AAP5]
MFKWIASWGSGRLTKMPDICEHARQQAMSQLLNAGALTPQYRSDVTSEKDFEERQIRLPLCTVWGEDPQPDGVRFTLSVSLLQVEDALLEQLSASEPRFRDERDRLHADIKQTVLRSLTNAVNATGAPPSVICSALTSSSS